MEKPMLSLTKYVEIPNAAHILYFFENTNTYVQNLVSYVRTGLEFGHEILIIENQTIHQMVKDILGEVVPADHIQRIHFENNSTFYGIHHDFHCRSIVHHFEEILQPLLASGSSVRTWAHVEWREQDDIVDKLRSFEQLADDSVKGMRVMSVCAYDASRTPAALQTVLMRNHEFYMTDEELVKSSLYRQV